LVFLLFVFLIGPPSSAAAQTGLRLPAGILRQAAQAAPPVPVL